tara:strand:+ start:21702 stop:23285 length:1584 start_codon:yes stop_codon:yes gene_type:complete
LNDISELNYVRWIIAFLPVLIFVLLITTSKVGSSLAGIISLLIACSIAATTFGSPLTLIIYGSLKGISLSFFVLIIIWASVFLYNLLNELGAIDVIGNYLISIGGGINNKGLLLGWCTSGFIQGITGFGVPVAVVAPLMVAIGLPLMKSVTAVLVGHAWAVTFGSIGSSYYALYLVTGINEPILSMRLAVMFILPVILTGYAVAHILGGWKFVIESFPFVLFIGICMSGCILLVVNLSIPQMASTLPASIGILLGIPLIKYTTETEDALNQGHKKNIWQRIYKFRFIFGAFSPYAVLILLSLLSRLKFMKRIEEQLSWGFSFPAQITDLGYKVESVSNFASISVVTHPGILIVFSSFITYLIYRYFGLWKTGSFLIAIKSTFHQSYKSSIAIMLIVMMAMVMVDAGMVNMLAEGTAKITSYTFPFFSPFIGGFGTFLTGSNTNSNLLFGALQIQTALSIGMIPVTFASAQSIGASLASAIAPAKILVGTTLVGIAGKEGEVLKKAFPYCILLIISVGIETLLFAFFE